MWLTWLKAPTNSNCQLQLKMVSFPCLWWSSVDTSNFVITINYCLCSGDHTGHLHLKSMFSVHDRWNGIVVVKCNSFDVEKTKTKQKQIGMAGQFSPKRLEDSCDFNPNSVTYPTPLAISGRFFSPHYLVCSDVAELWQGPWAHN